MSRVQFNQKSFSATRNILNAYFGAKFELAIELDKAKKSVSAVEKVIASDRADLAKLAMGESDGIVRTADAIRDSLRVNLKTFESKMAKYSAALAKCDKAISDAEDLFADKDSVLYKAYSAYAESLTDAAYADYATALSARFVELGLQDATADNVGVFMVNADKERKGRSAVKKGDIQSALAPKAFSQALLRKLYVVNKSAFSSDKFVNYVKKCAEEAAAKKRNK